VGVSIARDGSVWGCNSAGKCYRRRDCVMSAWEEVAAPLGALSQVSAQSFECAVGVSSGDDIVRFANKWNAVPGKAICASLGVDGTLWVVNRACVYACFSAYHASPPPPTP
jgi:hypothetical protein